MYRQTFPDDPGMHNMHNDGHTRTSYTSNPNFFQRVGNSLFGIVVGFVILILASGLLYWNEGRTVQTAKSLEEGLSILVPLKTTDVAFSSNNGRLVHLTGPLATNQMLHDPLYQLSVAAVKLRRNVEIFQWVEHETEREYNEGSQTRKETTYSYNLEWKSTLVKSSSFDNRVGHENPVSVAVASETHVADKVQVGSFVLSIGLVDRISEYRPLTPTTIGKSSDPSIRLYMGAVYHSKHPDHPQVGDLRITFEYAGLSQDSALGPATKVSIVARQIDEKLLPYQTQAGDTIELLYIGDISPQGIFGREQAQNAMLTWGVRFAGWLLMFVGFGCITQIITTIVDWVPIIRDLVAMGMTTMNIALSISLSLTVIAISWIRFRPLLGISILAMAAFPMFASRFWPKNQSSSRYRNA